jgi:hypothetical protein
LEEGFDACRAKSARRPGRVPGPRGRRARARPPPHQLLGAPGCVVVQVVEAQLGEGRTGERGGWGAPKSAGLQPKLAKSGSKRPRLTVRKVPSTPRDQSAPKKTVQGSRKPLHRRRGRPPPRQSPPQAEPPAAQAGPPAHTEPRHRAQGRAPRPDRAPPTKPPPQYEAPPIQGPPIQKPPPASHLLPRQSPPYKAPPHTKAPLSTPPTCCPVT